MTVATQLSRALAKAASTMPGTVTYKSVGATCAIGQGERLFEVLEDGSQGQQRLTAVGAASGWTDQDGGEVPQERRTVKVTCEHLGLENVFYTVETVSRSHGMVVMDLSRIEQDSD